MIIRSAVGRKIPHSRVFDGGTLYFMEKGTGELIEKQMARWHKKCICLVEFSNVEKIDAPLEFEKQKNMDDWLIIYKLLDVLAGTSIPYNYYKSKL